MRVGESGRRRRPREELLLLNRRGGLLGAIEVRGSDTEADGVLSNRGETCIESVTSSAQRRTRPSILRTHKTLSAR